MNTQMKQLVSLVATMLAIAGSGTTAAEDAAAPTAPAAPTAATGTAQAPTETTASAASTSIANAAAKVDSYTVVKGDSLSKIATRPEVFGNEKLWPLLYEDNKTQIKPDFVITPGQVLVINHSHSEEEIKGLLANATRGRSPSLPVKPVVAGKDFLQAAHRAYEAGDMEWTEYYYNSYLTDHPRDANAWGELGNVYHAQGKLRDAAWCFYNTANLLIQTGKTAKALRLMPAIQEGNPELADEIHSRLTGQ